MKYRQIEEVAKIVKSDYTKQIIFNTTDFNQKGHLLQVVTIPSKTKQRVHYHQVQTEVFYILEGECLIIINNQEFQAKPEDAFICEPGDKHHLWNKTDKDFKLVVFKINKPDNEDTVWEDK